MDNKDICDKVLSEYRMSILKTILTSITRARVSIYTDDHPCQWNIVEDILKNYLFFTYKYDYIGGGRIYYLIGKNSDTFPVSVSVPVPVPVPAPAPVSVSVPVPVPAPVSVPAPVLVPVPVSNDEDDDDNNDDIYYINSNDEMYRINSNEDIYHINKKTVPDPIPVPNPGTVVTEEVTDEVGNKFLISDNGNKIDFTLVERGPTDVVCVEDLV
jgi:hypothetical protein